MCATQCSSIQHHEHFSNCELINDFILRLFFWHHHIAGYEQFKSHCLNLDVSLIKAQTLQIKSKPNEKLTFHCLITIKCRNFPHKQLYFFTNLPAYFQVQN